MDKEDQVGIEIVFFRLRLEFGGRFCWYESLYMIWEIFVYQGIDRMILVNVYSFFVEQVGEVRIGQFIGFGIQVRFDEFWKIYGQESKVFLLGQILVQEDIGILVIKWSDWKFCRQNLWVFIDRVGFNMSVMVDCGRYEGV